MIESYTKIDQKDDYRKSCFLEFTNINGLTLNILEKSQTGEFAAWVDG